ncbi:MULTISPECIES: EspA/EspE family type VII secretion system effector [Mycobacteriaceae]|uniref:Uncharacterized protein n=1 Tax=Mycolicibacterium parafortuitum TaxID=39692 RepID=A0ACC6MC53_MYCPF|nr:MULTISPECIES: EspA/EspE family type VII secretion system effector [Mycobacteriaceae]MDZ5084540.1 hypothetical protein [Mycolicibacterium parafortuitum]GFM20441.1 uncharacterized protein PO1_contig-077-18 [Mycobacterium sp. PO1]GFM24116.1 uncharacterized protein PO2_contig-035-18 [Mycobacterium sp. PO2]
MRGIDGVGSSGKGTGSPVLEAGLDVIDGMRRTTGSGEPERGEAFRRGAQRFREAGDHITAAQPQDWVGRGAQAYGLANRRHARRVAAVAALDDAAHAVLARQAEQIVHRRHVIDDQADRLARFSRTSRDIATTPGVGAALKATFEMAAVATALDTCRDALHGLMQQVNDNADELRRITVEYAVLTDDPPGPSDAPAEQRDPGPGGREDENEAEPQIAVPAGFGGAGVPAATADVAGPAPESHQPEAMPAEAMSALSSAMGGAGGMIGALVAPVAAALAGVAGAVTQALPVLSDSPGTLGDEARSDDKAPPEESVDVEDEKAEHDETDEAEDPDRAPAPAENAASATATPSPPLLPPTVPSPAAPIRPPT